MKTNDPTRAPRIIVGNARFPLGGIFIAPRAREILDIDDVVEFLRRHAQGDWGECDPFDARANEVALQQGTRLLSVYRSKQGEKIWLLTEADRSATTILLPSEY